MPFIDVADEKIFYSLNASDQDRVIVTIHGSGGDHTNWPENLRNLTKADVYALDLPGHGQSSGDGRASVEAYTDFIEAFVTTLALENVTLFGNNN